MADDSKQYSLKDIETQLLNVFQQQQSVMLSNLLSFIAIERLAYTVTANTRFQLDPEFKKMTINEVEPAVAEQPKQELGVIDEAPKGKK
jgi:hypothetical protein